MTAMLNKTCPPVQGQTIGHFNCSALFRFVPPKNFSSADDIFPPPHPMNSAFHHELSMAGVASRVFISCSQPMRSVLVSSILAFLLCAHAEVHMLVPGFTVVELPVKISNINNLRFAPDGSLTALAYDGKVHLLRDSNGDGVEDSDFLFWDKSTLSVPVGMCWSTNGLYVSSHGKVSLLKDIDHDGKADEEEIIASGWPPTDVGSGGVDATAVTT